MYNTRYTYNLYIYMQLKVKWISLFFIEITITGSYDNSFLCKNTLQIQDFVLQIYNVEKTLKIRYRYVVDMQDR